MKEQWKDVVGFEGLYEISNLARVRRGRIPSRIRKTGRILTQRIDRHGYLCVDLWKQHKCKRPRVHVLLMEAFVGLRTMGQDTRHLDGDKLNNDLSNLRYGSRSENMKDSYLHDPERKGFRDPKVLRKAVRNRIKSIKEKVKNGTFRSRHRVDGA